MEWYVLAGFVILWLVYLLRQARQELSRSSPNVRIGQPMTSQVAGVYATVHTDKGDVATGLPEAVTIDCEVIMLYLPLPKGFSGRLHSSTLHLGVVNVETRFSPSVRAYGNENSMTVVHTISMDQLTPNYLPAPPDA